MIVCVAVSLTACAVKQYVGEPFDYSASGVCKCPTLPAECQVPTKHFDFTFKVAQLSPETYQIEGESQVAKNLQSLGQIQTGTFTFLLAKDGKVIDNVIVNPHGDLWSTLPFKKEFTSKEGFDGIMVTYNISYRQ